MAETEHETERAGRSGWAFTLLMVLPAVYVLGSGPFFWLREQGYLVRGSPIERMIVSGYGPLEELVQLLPPLKALLRWYIELFAPV